MNARNTTLALAGLAVCATLTGACAVANPDTSQAVLRYSGGWWSDQAFDRCIGPGVRDVTSAGMQHYYYTVGQQKFKFGSEPDADAPPLQVSTKGPTLGTVGPKLAVSGTVTYRLNTDCTDYKEYKQVGDKKVLDRDWPGGLFQRFHDTIGRHSNAFMTDGSASQPPGWNNVVRTYVGDPIQKASNDAGLQFTWQELVGDPVKNASWQEAVIRALPALVTQQAGADHFLIDNVQLLQPQPPGTLQIEVDNNQAAVLRRQTADTDKSTADVFGGIDHYMSYLKDRALVDAIREGKIKAIPVPFGSPVIVNSGGGR